MTYRKKIDQLSRKIKERYAAEKMSPSDRLKILRNFNEPDRATGSFAFWAPAAIGISEISTFDYYNDAEKMYYCQLAALDKFGHDYPLLLTDMYNTEAEALGSRIFYTDDDVPIIVEPALKQKDRLTSLTVPDPSKDGRLPYKIEICRLHKEIMGDFSPAITAISAPFSMAVGLRGYENLIIDISEDPEFVHELLDFCCKVIITFGKAIHQVSGSFPSLSDAWSSIPNLSPAKFIEFSLPYAARCFQAFGAAGFSFGGGHQFSENYEGSLMNILSAGCKSFMLFEDNISGARRGRIVDLRKVKEICKSKGVFMFTCIHPETMTQNSPSMIRDTVRGWFLEASSGGGHAFYASIFPGTPPENIHAYIQALKSCTFPVGLKDSAA